MCTEALHLENCNSNGENQRFHLLDLGLIQFDSLNDLWEVHLLRSQMSQNKALQLFILSFIMKSIAIIFVKLFQTQLILTFWRYLLTYGWWFINSHKLKETPSDQQISPHQIIEGGSVFRLKNTWFLLKIEIDMTQRHSKISEK